MRLVDHLFMVEIAPAALRAHIRFLSIALARQCERTIDEADSAMVERLSLWQVPLADARCMTREFRRRYASDDEFFEDAMLAWERHVAQKRKSRRGRGAFLR